MSLESVSTRDVLIQTHSIERATDFYQTILGMTVFLRQDNIIGLEAGAFRLFVDRGAPYGPVFEFIVADLNAAKDALLAAGCKIENDDPSVPRCYIRDPFGLTFNIAQRP